RSRVPVSLGVLSDRSQVLHASLAHASGSPEPFVILSSFIVIMNLLKLVQQTVAEALTGFVADPSPYLTLVKPTQDARFGDYQANCAMSLAKELGRKPREIAEELVRRLELGTFLEKPEIAGPGF